MLTLIRSTLNDPLLTITEQVQSLWSDYGAILRCFSPKLNRSVIVKFIQPPEAKNRQHPRGWNTQTSHNRKIKSYQIETQFYKTYANKTHSKCAVPQLIAVDHNDKFTLLVLDDLTALGFDSKDTKGTIEQVKQGIAWLAQFHASFMQQPINELWTQGGYWHLATRQDEWHSMPKGKLRDNAQTIDKTLQQAKFTTLLHGDAKLANLCFNSNTEQVAAVDFQYVGKGAGIIDLAYFIGSSLSEDDLYFYHEILLNQYLAELKQALQSKGFNHFAQLEQEYRELYSFEWADLYRFLLGWDPESWKINQYMKDVTNSLLTKLAIN